MHWVIGCRWGCEANRSQSSVSGIGTSTLQILINPSLAPGDVVTVNYAPGTITDDVGNPIAAFSIPAPNNTSWSAVQADSASGIGATIDVQFSDTVLCPGGCIGLSVVVGGANRSQSSVSGIGTSTLQILINPSLAPGDVVTVNYAPGTITDDAGNPVAAFLIPVANQTAAPAEDVTPEVSIKRGSLRLDRATGRFYQVLTLKNVGDQTLAGRISLVFDGLSTSALALQLSGTTFCTSPSGSPFIDLNVGSDGVFSRKEQIRVEVDFTVASRAEISYQNRLLSGLGCR